MIELSKLKKQYQGLKNTPILWNDVDFYEYRPIEIPFHENIDWASIDTSKHHRLGKLVEIFYQKNLEKQEAYCSLAHNIQIQVDKHQTIGELDFIIQKKNNEIHHIELAYKFYLYKPDEPNEINRWIGPNLKDSLAQKLLKLKSKQFPLLKNNSTKKILSKKGINPHNIKQSVHFLAQLYVPLHLRNQTFANINHECIKGYYISHQELDILPNSDLYHLPIKVDWLIDPKNNDTWCSFEEIKKEIIEQINFKHSPLLWVKRNKTYERLFITFW
ncbi:MAG: DUF1853 family protein [Wenyingzhuangia sp.]|uniref:DUF1853 family protein n=1 Tax=Wenyingzhuangia sp. TaxID=1964193 RepID=UPI00321AC8E2